MPLRLGAMLMFALLLSGCGDSFQFSLGQAATQSGGGAPFQERGEADREPNPPAPTEEGGGEQIPE